MEAVALAVAQTAAAQERTLPNAKPHVSHECFFFFLFFMATGCCLPLFIKEKLQVTAFFASLRLISGRRFFPLISEPVGKINRLALLNGAKVVVNRKNKPCKT